MSTSRAHYKFRHVYWVFKGRSGNGFLQQPGVEGSPAFPKWLRPPHYPGLKLKTGNKKGSAWGSGVSPGGFPARLPGPQAQVSSPADLAPKRLKP